MSYKEDYNVYVSIANNKSLNLDEKHVKMANEFIKREKDFNKGKIIKLANRIKKETGLKMEPERQWAELKDILQ